MIRKWNISLLIALISMICGFVMISIKGCNDNGIHSSIRVTARISFIFFSLAFTASSLKKIFKGQFYESLLKNRRYIGLGFAGSHFIHLGFIIFASINLEEFSKDQGMTQWISGGIAYVFITLMALTSTDKMVKNLGFKKWKKLHLIGSYIIFFVFAMSYLKHTFKNY